MEHTMSELIYGKSVIRERLRAKHPIAKLFVLDPTGDDEILTLAQQQLVKFEIRNRKQLDALVPNQVHQGYVAEIAGFVQQDLEKALAQPARGLYPFWIMLDKLEDPHNLGAIIRTVEALGVDGVIVPKHRSAPIGATVAKVSTGAIEYVPIVEVTNLATTMDLMKEKGYWFVGTDVAPTSVDYHQLDYKMPLVLVIGSEGFGLSRLVKEKCDFLAHIPMVGKINSLNASVATAICISHIVHSRM